MKVKTKVKGGVLSLSTGPVKNCDPNQLNIGCPPPPPMVRAHTTLS